MSERLYYLALYHGNENWQLKSYISLEILMEELKDLTIGCTYKILEEIETNNIEQKE